MESETHKASKEMRAKRLKVLRQLLGLTHKDFEDKYGIPFSNFQNWEGPRYGGLTEQGAKKILHVCKMEGITATLEWLMHGIEPAPIITNKFFDKNNLNYSLNKQIITDNEYESIAISNELLLFKKNYNNQTLELLVNDDCMEPYYHVGDWVAGKYFDEKNIEKSLNQHCIIKLATGDIVLRQLKAGTNKSLFNLICTNPNTNISQPIIYDAKITCAAPIIWVRRRGH